ncbi:kinase-like domain-containing protein [Chytridium lagenaria]|nr:kinase-like domain-containing protein [Chytridium lagenaria]
MQWADFELNAGFLDRAVGILEAGMKLKAEPLQDLVNMKMEIQGSSKKDNASNVKSKSENIGFVSISPRIASVSVPIDRKRDKLLDSQPAVSIQDSSSLNNNMNLNGQRGRKFFVNQTLYWRISLVGRGASSKVYKVMTEAGEIYALKKVKLKGQDSSAIRGYLNEVELLKRLSGCEHIIRLVDSEVDEIASVIYLVLEYGEIDLARLLVKLNGKPLNPSFIRLYWFQMLEAVRIIHEENIIHSDLKPANFIVVEGSLKLIDFGIANAIPNDTTNVHRDYQTGTINYMAPEAIVFSDSDRSSLKVNLHIHSFLIGKKLGRASDVWSLGCILYQLVYGQPPFANLTVLQKLHCIADPNYLISFTPIDDSNLMNVMRSCLNRNPKKRMGIPQLLNHRYLNPGVSPQQIPADCGKEGSSIIFLIISVAVKGGPQTNSGHSEKPHKIRGER